jgi:hypothetical protein
MFAKINVLLQYINIKANEVCETAKNELGKRVCYAGVKLCSLYLLSEPVSLIIHGVQCAIANNYNSMRDYKTETACFFNEISFWQFA